MTGLFERVVCLTGLVVVCCSLHINQVNYYGDGDDNDNNNDEVAMAMAMIVTMINLFDDVVDGCNELI